MQYSNNAVGTYLFKDKVFQLCIIIIRSYLLRSRDSYVMDVIFYLLRIMFILNTKSTFMCFTICDCLCLNIIVIMTCILSYDYCNVLYSVRKPFSHVSI